MTKGGGVHLSDKTVSEAKAALGERLRKAQRFADQQRKAAMKDSDAASNLVYWENEATKAKEALSEIFRGER